MPQPDGARTTERSMAYCVGEICSKLTTDVDLHDPKKIRLPVALRLCKPGSKIVASAYSVISRSEKLRGRDKLASYRHSRLIRAGENDS